MPHRRPRSGRRRCRGARSLHRPLPVMPLAVVVPPAALRRFVATPLSPLPVGRAAASGAAAAVPGLPVARTDKGAAPGRRDRRLDRCTRMAGAAAARLWRRRGFGEAAADTSVVVVVERV